MQDYQEIINQLPIDQLAQQVGASPDEVESAVRQAVPALLMGMDANAQDPAGANSLLGALGQHSPGLIADGVDVSQIDQADGEKITANIFGSNEDAVISQLGSAGGADGDLIKKLLPILAPIVMAWLAGKLMKVDQGQGQPTRTQSSSGGGILGQILGQVLGGGGAAAEPQTTQTQSTQPQFKEGTAPQADSGTPQMKFPDQAEQTQPTTQSNDGGLGGALGGGGGILGQILGGLLGGGKR